MDSAPSLALQSVSKAFGDHQAVCNLSFEVYPGEIFGLLGPNGAGKTTTIRLTLGLLKPDNGRVMLFGGPLDEPKKDRIGYMPEERGLYDMPLAACLIYLATLKNLPRHEAKARTEAALQRVELWEHRHKKISKLSRGMTQKAQIVAATLHRPDLLIIDEPFANLDPVNAQLIKEILLEMRAAGQSVIMSSHQMNFVEELCDRIVLINQGQAVLYGAVREVRRRYAGNEVLVAGSGDFSSLPGVAQSTPYAGAWRLGLTNGTTADELLRHIAARPDLSVERFEIALPSLDEIFIRAVGKAGANGQNP